MLSSSRVPWQRLCAWGLSMVRMEGNFKRYVEPVGNGALRLRLIEQRDLETTLAWRNRDAARVWFKTSNQLTLEQHQVWFHRYLNKDDDFMFVAEVGGKLVGQVSVYGIQWEKNCAEIGRFLVAPESGGKGYMTRASEALIRLCVDMLNLNYLFLEVIETNDRAICLYRRLGFLEEHRYSGLVRMGWTLK